MYSNTFCIKWMIYPRKNFFILLFVFKHVNMNENWELQTRLSENNVLNFFLIQSYCMTYDIAHKYSAVAYVAYALFAMKQELLYHTILWRHLDVCLGNIYLLAKAVWHQMQITIPFASLFHTCEFKDDSNNPLCSFIQGLVCVYPRWVISYYSMAIQSILNE